MQWQIWMISNFLDENLNDLYLQGWKTYLSLLILFITLTLGYPWRICLIKTLLRKNPMEKKIWGRKKSTISNIFVSLKTLPWKPSGTKPWWRKKECKIYLYFPLNQTIISERMKIIISYQLFKNYTWEWLCEKVWKIIMNNFVDCLHHYFSEDHLLSTE